MAGRILCVGAGLSGAVIGRELAEEGWDVTIVDARDHVAGNCHTVRDPDTGVLVHVYGPHIFHTGDDEVWAYVNRHETFRPFRSPRPNDQPGQSLLPPHQSADHQPVLRKDLQPRGGQGLHRRASRYLNHRSTDV